MFGLFKKKSELEKLQLHYEQLMKEAYELSHTNRAQSDSKYAEAEKVSIHIQQLKSSISNS
jgi:hypothetical protein